MGGPATGDAAVDALLADGRVVHIRRADDGDRDPLLQLHERLSDRSIYFRYFSASRRSGPGYVDRLLDPRHVDLLGLVAEVGGELIAIASYERLAGTDAAEVALLVDDAHQGSGAGTLLLECLAADAASRGIGRFVAEVLPENGRMLDVFARAGFAVQRGFESGVVHVEFRLEPSAALFRSVDERERAAEVRSLNPLFHPNGIAVVGAGRDGGAGHDILANLRTGGFTGTLYPVNPAATEVCGLPAYAKMTDLPGPAELAIVAVPARFVVQVARDCAAARVRVMVVVTAGFAEAGEGGSTTEHEMLAIARSAGIRVIGPNCLGVLNTAPDVRMQATFAEFDVLAGRLAIAAQSGALGAALVEDASRLGLGVSSFVSLGNKADVSGNDLLMYWEQDRQVDAIALYLESFGNPRKFARIARRISSTKPILAITAGRSPAAIRATRSHTAAGLTSATAVDALFRQAGVLRVESAADLVPLAAVLLRQPLPTGRRVVVVGNSGGPGAMAADACEAAGLTVPELPAQTQAALRRLLARGAAVANPVDLMATADPSTYSAALRLVLDDDTSDAVVVIHTALHRKDGEEVVGAVTAGSRGSAKPVVAVRIGFPASAADSVPSFPYPEQAVRALAKAMEYAEWRRRPSDDVTSLPDIDELRARRILGAAPPGWLGLATLVELLSCYRIPVLSTVPVASAEQAVDAANRAGWPVALKAASPDIVHKSDVGGVALALADADELRRAWSAMAAGLGDTMGGGLVQPMAEPGVELIVGVVQDPSFGPLVAFGSGGVTADLIGDRAYRLLPMTRSDAAELVRSLRTSPLLFGYRGAPPVDVSALEELLLRVARLAEAHPQIVELDLNPVVASPAGVTVVDAKMRIDPLAIGPALLPTRALRSPRPA